MRALVLVLAALLLGACDNDVPLLLYHWHGARPDSPWDVPPEKLRAQLDELQAQGFTTITLDQLYSYREKGTPLPPRPVVLTFDDGDQTFYSVAYPELKKRGLVAELFVVEGFLREQGEERFLWNGKIPMLLWPEVEEMSASGVVRIQSHSRSHPRLTSLTPEQLREEVAESRTRLQHRLGVPVEFFAYPGHVHNAQVMEAVQAAGYRGGVGGATRVGNGFDLFRMSVYSHTDLDGFRQLLAKNWADAYLEDGPEEHAP